MQAIVVRAQGAASPLRAAIRRDLKGGASMAIYALGIILAFVAPILAFCCYAAVAAWWLVPDTRVEAAPTSARATTRDD